MYNSIQFNEFCESWGGFWHFSDKPLKISPGDLEVSDFFFWFSFFSFSIFHPFTFLQLLWVLRVFAIFSEFCRDFILNFIFIYARNSSDLIFFSGLLLKKNSLSKYLHFSQFPRDFFTFFSFAFIFLVAFWWYLRSELGVWFFRNKLILPLFRCS